MNDFSADVLVIAPSFPPAFQAGGPAKSIFALAQSVPSDLRVAVLAPDEDSGLAMDLDVAANEWITRDWGFVNYSHTRDGRQFVSSLLATKMMTPSTVYINSFFNFKMAILPQVMHRLGWLKTAQFLVAPRGEFDGGALALKSFKKRAFIALYRLFRLDRSVVWHTTSAQEDADVKALWGARASTLLSENLTLYRQQNRPAEYVFSESGRLHAIFVGRVSPKKGLHLALEALASVSENVDLEIYGPEIDLAYSKRCHRLADALPENIRVRFHGAVVPEKLEQLYASADVLLMPTAGENFGHVIAESLAMSCPVIVADTTPWSSLITQTGAGDVVLTASVSAWRDAIRGYATLSPAAKNRNAVNAGAAFTRWLESQSTEHLFTRALALKNASNV